MTSVPGASERDMLVHDGSNKPSDAPRILNRIEAQSPEDIRAISDGDCNEEPVQKTQANGGLFAPACTSQLARQITARSDRTPCGVDKRVS